MSWCNQVLFFFFLFGFFLGLALVAFVLLSSFHYALCGLFFGIFCSACVLDFFHTFTSVGVYITKKILSGFPCILSRCLGSCCCPLSFVFLVCALWLLFFIIIFWPCLFLCILFFDRFSDALQSFSSFHLLRLSWFCRWVIVLYCFLWVAFSWWLCIACLAMFVVCDSFFIWSSDASSSSVFSCLCSVLCLSFFLLFFGVGTLALSTNCLIISLIISLHLLLRVSFSVFLSFFPLLCVKDKQSMEFVGLVVIVFVQEVWSLILV